jgi:hypothetical protein
MASAGYSGTPLIDKLGIKPAMKVLLVNEPPDYFDLIGTEIGDQLCNKSDIPDLIHLFVANNKIFETEIKKCRAWCKKNPALIIWVSWHKKSSKIPTDISEDTIRNYALKNNLVDVKVCAVSDIWSGLKLVVPLSKR